MNKKFSTGIIDKVIYNDTGNVMYYVIINVDGQFVTAQSINYTSESKTLKQGKEVKVNYYFTPKGAARVEILDEDIVSCIDAVKLNSKNIKLFIIVVIILLIIVIMKVLRL